MNQYLRILSLTVGILCAVPFCGAAKSHKDKDKIEINLPEPDMIAPKSISQETVKPIEEARRVNLTGNEFQYGIDVSHYQNRINWQEVAKDPNARYAFLKATEGAGLVDDTYEYNLREARKAGIKVGCYHFFSPTAPIEDQFRNLTTTVDLSTQDLIPIIDVEIKGKGSTEAFCNRLARFLDMVEKHYKVQPIIYTSSHFYNKYLQGKFTEYKYMIARYHDEEPVLTDDIKFVMWQFTAKGSINGIRGPVDRSKFMDDYHIGDILLP